MLWHIQDLRSADEKIWINFFIWYKLYSLDLRKLHLIYRVERIKELKKETMKQFWSNVLWYNLAVFLRMNTRIHMQITYISSYIYFLFHFCSRPPLNLISSFICEILPLHFHSSRHMDITTTHSFYTNHIQIFVGKLMLKLSFIYRIHSHFGIIMFSKTYGRPACKENELWSVKPWSLRRFIRSISHPFVENAVSHVLCV